MKADRELVVAAWRFGWHVLWVLPGEPVLTGTFKQPFWFFGQKLELNEWSP